MTGADFQEQLDGVLESLQTPEGRGKEIHVLFRLPTNDSAVYEISSDANGVIDPLRLADLQDFVDGLKPIADTYNDEYAPVVAREAFNTARAVHQPLIDAAAAARVALDTALGADPAYQAARTAYNNARLDPDFVSARAAYVDSNVSENYGNLSDAKGAYIG